MEDNRSVIQRLDDIEAAIKNNNAQNNTQSAERDDSINSKIGESFEEYFKESEVYYYEPDERKFQNHRKKQVKRYIIISLLYLIPIIAHILVSVVCKTSFVLLYIADVAFIATPLFMLIYESKQKSKKIANSKWNFYNHIFYIYDNNLGDENKEGMISLIFSIYKLLSFVFFICAVLPYLFGKLSHDSKEFLAIIHFIIAYVFLNLQIIIKNRKYYYHEYIFEKEDSYIITNGGWSWEKHNK